MAQLQWLGQIPRENKWSHLAQALKGGVGGFQAGQKIGLEREALKEKKVERIEKGAREEKGLLLEKYRAQTANDELKYKIRKMGYDTKMKGAKVIIDDVLPAASTEQRDELLAEGSAISELITSTHGKTTLEGLRKVDATGKEPSWAQAESVEGVTADIRRRRGVISDVAGQMLPFDMPTRNEALDYISRKKLDPSRFKRVLDEVYVTEVPVGGKKSRDKYKVGQKEVRNGVTYEYIGKGKWRY